MNRKKIYRKRRKVPGRKGRQIQLVIRLTLMCIAVIISSIYLLTRSREDAGNQVNASIKQHAADEPVKNTAKKNTALDAIMENKELYTENMLNALERNPEILDFVKKYPDTEAVVTGGLSAKEKKEEHPLFIQWDSRWGYSPYGNDNIGISGCGPTCLSMVIYSLTRNEAATPDAIANFSMAGGYYVPDVGTAWSLMTDAAVQYGLDTTQIPVEEAVIKEYLDSGHMLICSMSAGDFTDAGHFIVVWGYDENGFSINDPFSTANSSKTWDFKTLQPQTNNIWAYHVPV